MKLGHYPTRVERLDALSNDATTLWVKRDDATNDVYGGNKVRKLDYLIQEALDRGARRIVTFGAAGSHHVLATTVHGTAAGFRVAAVLTPQPDSDHARRNLRASLGAGLEPFACRSEALVPWTLARSRRPGDYIVPPGGSSVVASLGYAEAAEELASQVQQGEMPEPDAIVVALGSGGTAAGLTAGIVGTPLSSRIVAVRVYPPPLMTKASALMLAYRVARRRGRPTGFQELSRRFELIGDRIGRGYAHPTPWGQEAIDRAAHVGIDLEHTYTAKAFSHALRMVDRRAGRHILYWHTLSGADLEPLARGVEIPQQIDRLWC